MVNFLRGIISMDKYDKLNDKTEEGFRPGDVESN